MNLTQLLLDIQTTRGMMHKQLTDLERQVKEAIEEEHQERMRQHADALFAEMKDDIKEEIVIAEAVR